MGETGGENFNTERILLRKDVNGLKWRRDRMPGRKYEP